MKRIACLTVFVTTGSLMAFAQETPTPAQAPQAVAPAATPRPTQDAPAPADTPEAAAPAEVREIEIVEPANGEERRSIRVVGKKDGTFWVDDDGDTHDLSIVMDRSLESNPEIQAIRAEIAALMARLRQLEMKTATDVARKGVEIKRLKEKRAQDKELVEKKMKSPEELAELDAEIAAHDMELKYLVGGAPGKFIDDGRFDEYRQMRVFRGDGDAPVAIAMGMGAPRPPLKDIENKQLRDMLERQISLKFDNVLLREAIEMVKDQYEMNFNLDVAVRDIPITIDVKNVAMRDAFVALSDLNPDLVFIVRDYGVLVTTRDRAMSVAGPSIPEGVPYREGGLMGRRLTVAPHVERGDRSIEHVEERRVVTPAPPRVAPGAVTPEPAKP